jgi:MFS family permease|tara:strand:+ start:3635 stop:4990 length:1356 start_codon:yes stop_codon:yes gene_type:complete
LTTTAEDNYPGLGAASYALALLFVAYIFSFVDRQILSLLVGPIREDFGITDFEFSLLQGAAFAVIYTFAGLPLGRLADRYSRRLIISGSVMFWSLMTVSCGMTRNFGQLFVARMGVGVGEAGLSPAAYSLILDSFRPRHATYAMSFYKLGVKIGAGLALVIGGVLYDFYASIGTLNLPIIGPVVPWQATIISVGAPGVLLALLLLTVREPSRKALVANSDGSTSVALPVSTVFRFIWQRRRVYLSLFLGSSMMAMAGYGNAAWYPEFLFRNYGLSKSEAGTFYGTILLGAGSLGVLFGAWLANQLLRRGHADAYVRTILVSSALTIVPSVWAPLAGNASSTLVWLVPAEFLSASYIGVLAMAMVAITPNQMRGQITAMYIFVTNMLGLAIGASILAAFTDFVYRDESMLHYSIASINALFYPIAALLFLYCLPAYRRAEGESGQWKLASQR